MLLGSVALAERVVTFGASGWGRRELAFLTNLGPTEASAWSCSPFARVKASLTSLGTSLIRDL